MSLPARVTTFPVICSSSLERYLISVSFLERFNSISDKHPSPLNTESDRNPWNLPLMTRLGES